MRCCLPPRLLFLCRSLTAVQPRASSPPDYVVRPLYVALGAFSPALSRRCLVLIDANRAAWRAEAGAVRASMDVCA